MKKIFFRIGMKLFLALYRAGHRDGFNAGLSSKPLKDHAKLIKAKADLAEADLKYRKRKQ